MAIDVSTRQPARRRTDRPAAPSVRVSVVTPCLNEAENIEECILRARRVLERSGLSSEIIVVDNGSEDGSADLARAAGATVIEEPRRGYGRAYRAGFEAAGGEYIVMIDADLTYDFEEIPRFVAELDDGAELVMGNRMRDIEPGAMSLVSRVGNPIMTGVLNLVHRSPIQDAQCGMRAFRRDVLPRLDLHSPGFEFASEMVIRAAKAQLDVRQFPIKLHPRGGESKLSPFRDGWRNLRLILEHSPNALFTLPGCVMALLGVLIELAVFAHLSVFGRAWYLHALIAGAALVIVGVQVVGLGLCGRAYAVFSLGEHDPLFDRFERRIKLEHGLLLGCAIGAAGVALTGVVLGNWASSDFGTLGEERLAIVAMTLVVTGIQIFFTSFLISLLGRRRSD